MKSILSIQSHVANGYVGNRAAVFPLQVMGFDVLPVNTVQFSNHPGYGFHTGMVFPPEHVADVLSGLESNGFLKNIDAVLTGYMGSAALGSVVADAIARARQSNPRLRWCCDPVMGDTGPGFYVPAELQNFFRDDAVPAADIITPNKFELEALTGRFIESHKDAMRACEDAHSAGPSVILLTSLETTDTPSGSMQMIASERGGGKWIVTTPKLDFDPPPNGAGDMTSAIFMGHIVNGAGTEAALSQTAGSIFTVLKTTVEAGQRELTLIAAQEAFRDTHTPFPVTKF